MTGGACSNCRKEGHTITTCPNECKRCGSTHARKTMSLCRYDRYTADVLIKRFNTYKERTIEDNRYKTEIKIPFRNMNPPEDITENIVKFVIRKVDKDDSVVWCRMVGFSGDLSSTTLGILEVKSLTSNGPSSFGPKKKFNKIYFLDMREWLNDRLSVWKIDITQDSPEFKELRTRVEKEALDTDTAEEECLASSGAGSTLGEQCEQKRRPHLKFDEIKASIFSRSPEKVTEIFNGTFEDIFKTAEAEATPSPTPTTEAVPKEPEVIDLKAD